MASIIQSSIYTVAAKYAEKLQIKVPSKIIQRDVLENPYYPSIYALKDQFTQYNVQSEAYEVKGEDVFTLEPPFVAYITVPNIGPDFVLVTSIDQAGTVGYLYDSDRSKRFSKAEFEKRFRNIIWLIEGTSNEFSPVIRVSKKLDQGKFLNTLAFLLAGLILSSLVYQSIDFNSFLLVPVLLKMVGIILSFSLLGLEFNKTAGISNALCSLSKKDGCDAVTSSKYSKIFGISWSEIGFLYFLISLTILAYGLFSGQGSFWVIKYLAIGVVPYTLFSIYTQWKLIKNWCPICLGVQVVLLIESIFWLLPVVSEQTIHLFSNELFVYVSIILFIVISFYSIKSLIGDKYKLREYSAALKRLQKHPEVFQAILAGQIPAIEGWEDIAITVGPTNADYKILKICNPYCNPCANAHAEIDRMLGKFNNVSASIIFAVTNDATDSRRPVVEYFLNKQGELNPQEFHALLSDWYRQTVKDFDLFVSNAPLQRAVDQSDRIAQMKEWSDKASIEVTPTFYLNGKRLPQNYTINDLHELILRANNDKIYFK